MGFMDIAGSVIDTGIGLWQQHRQNERTDNQRKEDQQMQLDFAKNGIRWKVDDAVAAGLHPLAAVGAMGATYNPPGIATGGIVPSEMGQNISRSVRTSMTAEEKELHDLTIEEMRSRIGETDARRDYYLSEAARNHSPGTTAFPSTGAPPDDLIAGQGAQQISRDKDEHSRIAGSGPLWQKTEIAPGTFVDLPYSQGESPLESMESWPAWLLAAWKNVFYNRKHAWPGQSLSQGAKDKGQPPRMREGIWHGN